MHQPIRCFASIVRSLLLCLGLTVLCSVAAQTVGHGPARVGYLGIGNATSERDSLEAFGRGMRDHGWIEGRTLRIEYRGADGKVERLPAAANELVRLGSDVIVVSGLSGIRAAEQATNTVPIVVAAVLLDPVNAGFAKSLGRPGGNITGLASQYEEIITKQVQLLTEVVPGLSQLVLLHFTGTAAPQAEALAAAEKLGVKARVVDVRNATEFEFAFKTSRQERAQAVLVLPSPSFYVERRKLAELAARYGLPAMYEFGEYVRDGGLISYGVDILDMYRRSAGYVDRILKGAKPGDLAIERPATFELVINLKVANALGLTIPPSVLSRADRIIR